MWTQISLEASIALLVVLIVGVIIYISYQENFEKHKEQLALLLSSLGSIALLITIYDRRNTIRRQLDQDKYRVIMDDLSNQRQNFMAPLKDIMSYYPESLPIYYEMFNVNGGKTAVLPDNIDPIKQKMVEQNIALTIFQIVENFLSVATITSPPVLTEWMSRMVVWFQSPTLQAIYQQQKPLFSDDAIQFIDNIIIQSNRLQAEKKPLTVELVRKYSEQIQFNPRVKST